MQTKTDEDQLLATQIRLLQENPQNIIKTVGTEFPILQQGNDLLLYQFYILGLQCCNGDDELISEFQKKLIKSIDPHQGFIQPTENLSLQEHVFAYLLMKAMIAGKTPRNVETKTAFNEIIRHLGSKVNQIYDV